MNNTTINQHIVLVNKFWESKNAAPFATVITAHYNRPHTIKRAMDSVENQTFRDIEYIIIDDGSTNSSDEIIKTFMNETKLPVMFIKQEKNRGVHTARNLGVKYARGKFLINLDSDDELLPRACEIFHDAWASIPDDKKHKYFRIVAYCKDQNGNNTGAVFPKNVNEMPEENIKNLKLGGDQESFTLTEILKANPTPEPSDLKFVSEVIQVIPLVKKYLSWFVNETALIYHKEGDDHISSAKNMSRGSIRSLQGCKDDFWNAMYQANHSKIYIANFKYYLKYILHYCMVANILKEYDPAFVKKYKLEGFKNKFWQCILFFPAMLLTNTYKKKRCKF